MKEERIHSRKIYKFLTKKEAKKMRLYFISVSTENPFSCYKMNIKLDLSRIIIFLRYYFGAPQKCWLLLSTALSSFSQLESENSHLSQWAFTAQWPTSKAQQGVISPIQTVHMGGEGRSLEFQNLPSLLHKALIFLHQ